jgi:hypothetical protein
VLRNEEVRMTEPAAVDTSADAPRYREAFHRLKDELRAIPEKELLTLNLDPQLAVTTTLRALPEVKAMRSRLIAEFTNFDVTSFDKLEDYAIAFQHANTVYEAAAPDATKFEALLQESIKQRDILDADLRAAIARGHINGLRLKELRSGAGYRNVAADLFILVEIARTDWPKLEGKTFITLSELNRGERLAEDLNGALAERDRLPGKINEAADDSQRAFTAFARTHGKTRRAIQYLRDEYGDLDEIMPSIYNGRASGRKRETKEGSEPTGELPDGAEVPGEASEEAEQEIPVGMPGASPFVRG